jgi:hypothetical protein
MSRHLWVALAPEIIVALSPMTMSRQISGPTCPYSTLSADFCQPGAKSGGVYKSVGNCLRPTCACAAPMIRGGWGQAAFVIPAQAGIQPCEGSAWVTAHAWTPAFAGVTALLASPQRIPTEIDTEPRITAGLLQSRGESTPRCDRPLAPPFPNGRHARSPISLLIL